MLRHLAGRVWTKNGPIQRYPIHDESRRGGVASRFHERTIGARTRRKDPFDQNLDALVGANVIIGDVRDDFGAPHE